MIEQNLNQVTLSSQTLKLLKARRDQEIVNVFKETKSIAETRKRFNNLYSRDVVRLAIFKAGIYDKNTRLKIEIEKANNRKSKRTYEQRAYSRRFNIEIELQNAVKNELTKHNIYFNAEYQIPGSQMRADFIGNNWLIETKVHTDSQSMLVCISQCMIYAEKLNLKNKALLIPDDIDPTDFFVKEFKNYNIKLLKFSQLVKWLKEINGYR
jgi:hypothetical protein